MKITKHFFTIGLVLIIFSVSLGFAAPESFKKVAEVKSKAVARVIKKPAKVDKKLEGFVVGKNLKVVMTLDQAITLLGVPKKTMSNARGTGLILDSTSIEYAAHGVMIHTLSGKPNVEAIDLFPTFKGQFANGIKMRDKVPTLIIKYSVPQSLPG